MVKRPRKSLALQKLTQREGSSLTRKALRVSFPRPWILSGLAFFLVLCIAERVRAQGHDQGHVPTLSVQVGHHGGIASGVISLDGAFVLTGGDEGTAILWSANTGKEIRRLVGPRSKIVTVALSPDNSLALTGNVQGTALLWKLSLSEQPIIVEIDNQGIDSVSFSPFGDYFLVVRGDGTVNVREVSSGKLLRHAEDSADHITLAEWSGDQRFLYTGGSGNTILRRDAKTGNKISAYEGLTGAPSLISLSRDGTLVSALGPDGTIVVWNTETGERLKCCEDNTQPKAHYIAFHPEENKLLVVRGGTMELRDVLSGEAVGHLDGPVPSLGRLVKVRGKLLGLTSTLQTVEVWDVTARNKLQTFEGNSDWVVSVAFSPDGKQIVVGESNASEQVWDTTLGTVVRQTSGQGSYSLASLAFSPDGSLILNAQGMETNGGNMATSEHFDELQIRSPESDRPEFKLRGPEGVTYSIFSKDGRCLGIGGYGWTKVLVWGESGYLGQKNFQGGSGAVRAIAFANDCRYMLTGTDEGTIQYWDLESPKPVQTFDLRPEGVASVALSSDGRQALSGSSSGKVRFYDDVQKGKEPEVMENVSPHPVFVVAFSPKEHNALSASSDGSAVIWDLSVKKKVVDLIGHSDEIRSATFSPDGKHVLTGSFDGTTKVWDASSGCELIQLVSFTDGTWIVSTPKGQFDSSNLLDISGASWIFPDDPLNPMAPEAFMGDYFEPRLLTRVIAGERFNDPAMTSLNRLSPLVQLQKVEWGDEAKGVARLTVKVARSKRNRLQEGKNFEESTGVYDLHILRDGQVVDAAPETRTQWLLMPIPPEPESDKQLWREKTRLDLDSNGTKELVFNVQVAHPRKSEEEPVNRWTKWMYVPDRKEDKSDLGLDMPRGTVEFGAYAFNEDRIKSPTSFQPLDFTFRLQSGKTQAYVICVGVDRTQSSPSWDLQYAAADAREMCDTLGRALKPEFTEVVPIRLVSDPKGQLRRGEATATTDHLKTVLDLLAGRPVPPELKKQIPNVSKIVKAQPEDLVMLITSSHGYTDRHGVFHMVLFDIGENTPQDRITESLQNRSLSSNQLSAWLIGVDVRDLVMIVDACHSEATVKIEGFKPGPMGSRGLGQLAFDKGMRILAASQKNDLAFENLKLEHGLLTYALLQTLKSESESNSKSNAKSEAESDPDETWNRKDGITMKEWLDHGAALVPVLYRKYSPASKSQPDAYQRPVFFDFQRQSQNITMTLQK